MGAPIYPHWISRARSDNVKLFHKPSTERPYIRNARKYRDQFQSEAKYVDDADFAKRELLGKTSTPSMSIYSNHFAGINAPNEWFVTLRPE
jgi:hypothetical protein